MAAISNDDYRKPLNIDGRPRETPPPDAAVADPDPYDERVRVYANTFRMEPNEGER